jgi:talin
MHKSKEFGDGMKGMAKHAKPSEHQEFRESVRIAAEGVCGLIEAAAQIAYLVGMANPFSVAGRKGLVNQSQFTQALLV